MRGVLLMVLVLAPLAAAAKDQWTELRTDHFTIVGNTRVSTLRETGASLERMRNVFDVAFDGPVDPPVPVVVFVVRREEDLRELAPDLWKSGAGGPVGFFQDVRTRMHIAIRLDANAPATAALHEYHHMLTTLSHPELPMWLSEGIASIWGEAQVKGRVVEVGRLDPAWVASVRGRVLDVDDLVDSNPTLTRAGGFRHAGEFHAHAKLFVHMLRWGRPNGAELFDTLLAKIASGVPARRALTETYQSGGVLVFDGKNGLTLQDQFDRYVALREFAFQRIELAQDPATGSAWVSRTLTDSEALARRGEMLRLGGGHPDQAAILLRAALRADPTEPRALANLAALAPPEDARRLVSKIDGERAPWEAHWIAARVLAQSSAASATVVTHLEEVLEREPGHVPAHVQLAKIVEYDDPQKALRHIDEGSRRDLARTELLMRKARILQGLGQRDIAEVAAAESAKRAAALPDRYAARVVCELAVGWGFKYAGEPACDAAVMREIDDWRSRERRAFVRGARGDLAGALDDLRASQRRAVASGVLSDAAIEERERWIRELEAGRNPLLGLTHPYPGLPDEWAVEN